MNSIRFYSRHPLLFVILTCAAVAAVGPMTAALGSNSALQQTLQAATALAFLALAKPKVLAWPQIGKVHGAQKAAQGKDLETQAYGLDGGSGQLSVAPSTGCARQADTPCEMGHLQEVSGGEMNSVPQTRGHEYPVEGALSATSASSNPSIFARYVWLLLTGIITGILLRVAARVQGSDIATMSDTAFLGILVLQICLLFVGAFFEEALFRGVMFLGICDAFARIGLRDPAFAAGVASALIFALLHLSGAIPSTNLTPMMGLEIIARAAQTMAFGLVMTMVLWQSGSIWPGTLLHLGFNILYFAPLGLFMGVPPTFVLGGTVKETIAILVGLLLLAPLIAPPPQVLRHQ